MLRLIERLAHGAKIAGDAGCGLVMGDEHHLYLVGTIGLEALGEHIDGNTFAPGRIDHIDLEPQADAHVDPQMRELAETSGEDLVAG
jgi:hypothetical protein